jgi:N-acetylglucosaminyldiphosphoundecaprenol N-acetyl-beta-D-mannosaminyltransferase
MRHPNLTSVGNQGYEKSIIFYSCGVRFLSFTPAKLCKNLQNQVRTMNQAFPVRFVNAYSLSISESTPGYREILNGVGVNIVDSATIVKVSRLAYPMRRNYINQIRGVDFLRYMLSNSNPGIRHVFIGSSKTTLSLLQTKLTLGYPTSTLAEFIPLPYSDDIDLIANHVFRIYTPKKNDIIWLSLGTPKQDLVSYLLATKWKTPVIGIGAAFDFLAGTTSEAPASLIRFNLEWLYRLITEPQRLWKRYFFGNIRFMFKWFKFLPRDKWHTEKDT